MTEQLEILGCGCEYYDTEPPPHVFECSLGGWNCVSDVAIPCEATFDNYACFDCDPCEGEMSGCDAYGEIPSEWLADVAGYDLICDYCRQASSHCYECEHFDYDDNMIFSDAHGAMYCEDCYWENGRDNDDSSIHPYSYKPDPIFHHTDSDAKNVPYIRGYKRPDKFLFLGVEP